MNSPPNIALQPTSPASPSPRLSFGTLGARSCSQPGSTNRSLSVYLAIGCVLALMCTKPASVEAQALLGTAEGSNQAVVFPSPNVGLPFPIQLPITGITGSNQPHGVSIFGQDDALVAGGTGIYVVRVSTREVVSIIPTAPYYDGSGSLAVSPNRSVALASGGSNQVTVIAAPFGPGSQISTVALPGGVPQQTTQAIAFAPSGRAFIYNEAGVSVLDPTYTAVSFTIPVNTLNPGRLAVTPDGKQVLTTNDVVFGVQVFTEPLSAASLPSVIPFGSVRGGIAVVPDGSKALVSSDNAARLFVVSAPFNASSHVEEIALPAVFTPSADVGISADGQLAILAGQGGFATPDIAFVRAPFTAVGASIVDVRIPGGRGNGAARFAPAGSAASIPDSSWPARVVEVIGMLLIALFLIGRLSIGK